MSFADYLDLFGMSFLAALLAGVVYPLVGSFLFLRRTGFYGVALPQFAATGVAAGFAAAPWAGPLFGVWDLHADAHGALNYHLAWAALFTLGCLGLLTWLGRRGGSEVANVAALFALSGAGTILFASASPVGEIFVRDQLLRGQILAVGPHELETIGAVLAVTMLCIAVCHRDLVLVAYDRETARVLGKRVGAWDLCLHGLTGLSIAAGTMTVGPVVLFGLLVLPPLVARSFARSMASMLVGASLLGLAASALGIWISYLWDWHLGPAVVVAAALPLPLTWLLGRESS